MARKSDIQIAREKYLTDRTVCPFCGSAQIFDQGSFQQTDHTGGEQKVLCNTCETDWIEEYKLVLITIRR